MENLFSSFEGYCSLAGLFELDKGKFGEHLYVFNDSVVVHQLRHVGFVHLLRNSTYPKLPYDYVAGFFSHDFLVHGV